MTDKPLTVGDELAPDKVKALEMAAIDEYRREYPEGPAWQELTLETRVEWMSHVFEMPTLRSAH